MYLGERQKEKFTTLPPSFSKKGHKGRSKALPEDEGGEKKGKRQNDNAQQEELVRRGKNRGKGCILYFSPRRKKGSFIDRPKDNRKRKERGEKKTRKKEKKRGGRGGRIFPLYEKKGAATTRLYTRRGRKGKGNLEDPDR